MKMTTTNNMENQRRKLEDILVARKNRSCNEKQEEEDIKRILEQKHDYETEVIFRGGLYKIKSFKGLPHQLNQLNIYCFNEYYDSVKPFFACKDDKQYRLFQRINPLVFRELYSNDKGFPIMIGETFTRITDDMIDKFLGDVVISEGFIFLFDIGYEKIYHNDFARSERLGWDYDE
jgi:hypothetical protein